jgi:hypothetical protein
MLKKDFHKQEIEFEKQAEEEHSQLSKSLGPLEAILSNINVMRSEQKESVSETNNRIDGIVVGRIVDADKDSVPKVDFPINESGAPLTALSTISVNAKDKGREVALGFINGDSRMPIILGFMHRASSTATSHVDNSKAITVEKDGEVVTISADKEIVLKCGESSITLTRAGKVLLNGAYISSRSTGINRLRGGSVLIN